MPNPTKPCCMKAMVIKSVVNLERSSEPLEMVDIPVPQPADDEVLLKVLACGVCHPNSMRLRAELHLRS